MRDALIHLLQTPEESAFDITLFSVWHILYVVLILGAVLFLSLFFARKAESTKRRLVNVLAILPICIYVLDFFAMPLAYGEIDVDKLPFHFCTLLSVLILGVQFGDGKHATFWRESVTVLSIVTPLMYLCYPGSALGGISPFCYRVIQTFIYHGVVFAYGVVSLAMGRTTFHFKKIWKAALLIALILCWSAFGNAAYSSPEHTYDWGFIAGGTFPFVPKPLMPIVVLACVFGMCATIYGIYYGIRHLVTKKQNA